MSKYPERLVVGERDSEHGPDVDEMACLGFELRERIEPLLIKYPGLEVVCCYGLPRVGRPDVLATACVSTHEDNDFKRVLVILVNVAKDVSKFLRDRGRL